MAAVSGSEKGLGPAYVSEHGLFDAPPAVKTNHYYLQIQYLATVKVCVHIQKKSKFRFGSVPIHDPHG